MTLPLQHVPFSVYFIGTTLLCFAMTTFSSSWVIQSAVAQEAAAENVVAPSDATEAGAPEIPVRPRRLVDEEVVHEDGRLRFSFEGQRWIDVLQWFAKISDLTLDWQELPEDELNLSTQKSYTIAEARDLLNMHLATRGFTLLRRGEVLTLVKLDKINPIIVPRVDDEELDQRDLHEIVRVSLPLDWLVAEDAVKEFEPMLSPFGKLLPMRATNRLEAMDTVINLKEIRSLLKREQDSNGGEKNLIVEFKLKHAEAEAVADKVQGLLGLDNMRRVPTAEKMRLNVEKTRAAAELAKNLGKDAATALPKQSEVNLIVNQEENSILVNAPPDKLAIIRQAIQAIDIPAASGALYGQKSNLEMKVYQTKRLTPGGVFALINNMRHLKRIHKDTTYASTESRNQLIVYALPEDHITIANLIEELDDDGRILKILPLFALEPDYAVQAVRLLLAAPTADGMRIEPDAQESRLLLWANDDEHRQVVELLQQLGETPAEVGERKNLRVLDVPGLEGQQALEKLQQIWPSLRENPLKINGPQQSAVGQGSAAPIKSETTSSSTNVSTEETHGVKAERDRTAQYSNGTKPKIAQVSTSALNAEGRPVEVAQNSAPKANSADSGAASINVTQNSNGQLIIASEDLDALDALESLLKGVTPEPENYRVFHLKHASPFSIELSLRTIFVADLQARPRSTLTRLPSAPQRNLQFISNIDSKTLLVQYATPEQMAKIAEIVEIYDQPESIDKDFQRQTKLYEVRHSRATAVADAVKEIYRDLLSSNDRTFGGARDPGYASSFLQSRVPRYKGLLSIAVEEKTNTVIVSAPSFLIDDVMELVQKVDERATEQDVTVVRKTGVGAEQLRQIFETMPEVSTSRRGPRR